MTRSRKNYIIVFLISFVLIWLSTIFYFDKNEFDIEFREKGITTATIFNFGTEEVIEEYNDGRSVDVSDVEYIEYSYVVNGKSYKYGSEHFPNGYSIGDKIEIEYVKGNPLSSRLKGLERYKFNFFIRNLLMVSIFSFLLMLATFYILGLINNKDTGWES
ncbi:DUF3592 domain-containing protein [Polaribacter butkevichii]|uniref:DUF3592 domain-containing protein n=1 Tax=Polaribacter butkevichii TaxID=218490 RepID=A0A2P6CFC2_9FLAO|nr:DUF3592 domain-containing protein [Polaribacter butkevichii]PQJ73610.1 hypothetical protein BTO14_10175 [Polaribacter butkevichii]